MASPSSTGGVQRSLALGASIALVVAALYFARPVLMPVVLAILFTFLLTPLVTWVQRGGIGRVPAVLIVVLLASSVVTGMGTLVLTQVRSLAAELPHHKAEIIRKIESLRSAGDGGWVENVNDAFRDISKVAKGAPPYGENTPSEPIPVYIESSSLPWLQGAAAPAAEFLVTTALVLVLVVFMLVRREDLRNRLLRLWGHYSLTTTTKAFDEAGRRIGRFLLVQFVLNTTFGLLLALGLTAIGVPYPVLWGFMAGALRYIPYLGTWIGALFPLALSIAVMPGWTYPLLVFGLFLALELTWANVLEPHFHGHSIGVSEVAMLVSAAFWGWLWGPIGLVLAAPLTACLAVTGKYVPQLEFFHTLLGVEPPLEPHLVYFQRVLARDHDEAVDVVEDFLTSHSVDQAIEELLVPVLSLAKRKSGDPAFTAEDEKAVYEVTREVLEELPEPVEPSRRNGTPVTVFGIPAGNEADQLTLEMLAHQMRPTGCRFVTGSAQATSGELVANIREEDPQVIVLSALAPQSVAHTRYLCKRLHTAFPDKKLVVGCWGYRADLDRIRERLQKSGADHIGTTLGDTRSQLTPLVQFMANREEPAPEAQRVSNGRAVGTRVAN
jgi:predicted PurR-regulated permease PerM/methylmalonyl-CoA mutase cobalamin-binding subunit